MEAFLYTTPAITLGSPVRSPLRARQALHLPPTAAAAASRSRSPVAGLGFRGRLLRARSASEDDSSTATFGRYVTASRAETEAVKGTAASEDDAEAPPAATEGVAAEEQPSFVNPSFVNFLDQLDLKLDSEDTYFILIYGTGAFVALWISSAIVGAIDSLPLFPKVMEVIGLGFTIWFTYRYLIFKKNRDELFEKIEHLKEQIIGPSVD